jgi:predicted dehydrogenase
MLSGYEHGDGESKMDHVRLGLIGCGWIAAPHVRAAAELSDRCRLVWVADPDAERAGSVAAQAGCRALADYHEGLSEVDAVIVATPHHLHAPMVLDVARVGKHILVEKPLATTLEDADRMLRAVEEAGVTMLVGYTRHYQPEFRRLRSLVESGQYGRVLTLSATMQENVGGYVSGWLANKEQLGGGCFFSAGGHPLEWLVSLGGPVEEIHLVMERFAVAMDGEDTVVAAFRFASGALGTLTQSWCQPNTSAWMSVRADCTEGAVALALTPMRGGPGVWEWEARLSAEVRHEAEMLYQGTAGFEFTPQLAHFLDCLAGRAEPETGGPYARALMAAILQGYATARPPSA